MNLLLDVDYMSDVKKVSGADIPWEKLENKSILISGATGLLGSFLVDVIAEKNKTGLNCSLFALGRNRERAKERFGQYWDNNWFSFVPYDINKRLIMDNVEKVDYVLHLASNTHPLQYSMEPISTITTNIIGLQNMLDFAFDHACTRFAFASSNEIYGENRNDTELFDEDYCGYINCNTLRAGYPESKRCGEALCQAYRRQKNMDIVIPRFTRSYGPSMLMTDSKAISQFIRKAIAGEDIVLKSAGTQYYSYTYVADAIYGLLIILLRGEDGQAYNIADTSSDIMLKDLAEIIAKTRERRVVFELPDEKEAAGYSTATKARLNGDKLKKLGWKPFYSINEGIERTVSILSRTNSNTM